MKPILLAAVAVALTTSGLTADDPKPGSPPVPVPPVPKKAAPPVDLPADKPLPKAEPALPGVPPKLEPPPDPLTPPDLKPGDDNTDPFKSTPADSKHDDDKAVPDKNVDPRIVDPKEKQAPDNPAASPEKKESGVSEIKQKGPLHFAAGQDLPLNGKMVIYGDDGAKQREVIYKDGKIQSWIEWQTKDVKIERTYHDDGHEIKRTGWKGDMKWFEISFGTETDGDHAKTAPKDVAAPKTVDPDAEPKKLDPVDPVVPEKKNEGVDPKADPEKPDPSTSPKADPSNKPVAPESSSKKSSGPSSAKKTDTPESSPIPVATDEPVKKHTWPAFVPGNPIFPEPTKDEDEATAKPDSGASSNLNKLKGAQTAKPDTNKDPDKVDTPSGGTDPKPSVEVKDSPPKKVGPGYLEIRENELAYSGNLNVPFSGKASLYKVNYSKIYFELLKRAASISSLSKAFSAADFQRIALHEMSEIEIRKKLKENLSEQDLLALSMAGHGLAYKQFEGEFTDGRRNGLGVEYYPDGTKKYVGVFKGGELHDGWVYWYYYGTTLKKMETQYRSGVLVEAHSWSRDGALRW